jgi:hypothetical protein
MAGSDNVDYRITWLTASPVLLMASATDLTMFLLTLTVIGEAPAEIGALMGDWIFPAIFFLFYQMNYNKNSLQKLGLTAATDIVKTAPVIGDIYPGFTIEIVLYILMMRKEDRDGAAQRAGAGQNAAAGAAATARKALAARTVAKALTAASAVETGGASLIAAEAAKSGASAAAKGAARAVTARRGPGYNRVQDLRADTMLGRAAARSPEALVQQKRVERVRERADGERNDVEYEEAA